MSERIYAIKAADGKLRLVEASTELKALMFCVKPNYKTNKATQADFREAMESGIKIERATGETEQEE